MDNPATTPPAPQTLTPAPAGPGRIVHYRLTEEDAERINRRRTDSASIRDRMAQQQWPVGAQAHIGNAVTPGDYCPMVVVRCWDGTTRVNGQVFLDGNDTYWVTSAELGAIAGTWCWPPRT